PTMISTLSLHDALPIYVTQLIDKKDSEQWSKDISEYVWETDTKTKYDVTAFKTEDPFFVLEMETIIPTGYYHEQYIEEITLNNNGSLKVVAKDQDEKVIKDIEPLKITFKYKI